jgi:pyruvate/2-oxoglutarate dehydrogenase complex dihydrolipoamide acyltransferase (E2) component
LIYNYTYQKEVEDGKVDPIMLHEGETAKEGAEMLELGTEDHRDDPKAEVPMPDAAEQQADALDEEDAAADGQ